jgi:hypothetical protein
MVRLWQIGRWPNPTSRAILLRDSAAPLVATCPLPTDPGRLEHDLLQGIATGDDDHEVELARGTCFYVARPPPDIRRASKRLDARLILLHRTPARAVPAAAF